MAFKVYLSENLDSQVRFPGDFNYQLFSFKARLWNLNLSKYCTLLLGFLPLSSALSLQTGMNESKGTCELSSLFRSERRLLHLLPIWHLQVKWSYSLILNSPFSIWTHCKSTPPIPSISLNDVYITEQSPFSGFLSYSLYHVQSVFKFIDLCAIITFFISVSGLVFFFFPFHLTIWVPFSSYLDS